MRRNRIGYLGIGMEFHLFKNADIQDVLRDYRAIQITDGLEEAVPVRLKLKEINLHPGVKLRKKGIHQKGIKIYSRRPDINPDKPLVLAVISQSKWLKDREYLQDYTVVVKIRHKKEIDIYNLIKQQIEERIVQRVRVK